MCRLVVWNLVNKGRIYEEILQHPRVLELQEYLLGDDCILWHSSGVRLTKPL